MNKSPKASNNLPMFDHEKGPTHCQIMNDVFENTK